MNMEQNDEYVTRRCYVATVENLTRECREMRHLLRVAVWLLMVFGTASVWFGVLWFVQIIP